MADVQIPIYIYIHAQQTEVFCLSLLLFEWSGGWGGCCLQSLIHRFSLPHQARHGPDTHEEGTNPKLFTS